MAVAEFPDADHSEALAERVLAAREARMALRIVGGDSKPHLGHAVQGEEFSIREHRGIVDYAPTELVITARAGTPLAELENTLTEHGQMMSFEPPHLGEGATLGGSIACGLSGPRRPYAGAARDLVLGVRIINGRGEILTFGGQVMKNVAGYDVSRLMVGAQGTLGVLLEVSLKVLPGPEYETTLVLEMDAAQAIETMNSLAGQAVPLSAACHLDGRLWLRLSALETAVNAARQKIGGEEADNGQQFWLDLREQRLAFFEQAGSRWRLSVPPASAPLDLPGDTLLDWGGAQRWLISDAAAETVQAAAQRAGGYASLYSPGELVLPPLAPAQLALQQRIKTAFDPEGILNPGRQYPEI